MPRPPQRDTLSYARTAHTTALRLLCTLGHFGDVLWMSTLRNAPGSPGTGRTGNRGSGSQRRVHHDDARQQRPDCPRLPTGWMRSAYETCHTYLILMLAALLVARRQAHTLPVPGPMDVRRCWRSAVAVAADPRNWMLSRCRDPYKGNGARACAPATAQFSALGQVSGCACVTLSVRIPFFQHAIPCV